MRPSVPRSLHYCLAAIHRLAGEMVGCGPWTTSHSQALSFMRAIDAQSAIVEKARYLANMEQP
jgi:hypothetical protein